MERVLQQWEVLVDLFRLASIEEKNPVAHVIFTEMQNPYVRAYLSFFKYILPTFNQFNTTFQSQKILITVLATESERFIRLLCCNFIRPEYYKNENLYSLNVFDPHVLFPIEKVCVGPNTMDILKDCDKVTNEQFILKCLTFYQKAVEQSLLRFPVKDDFFGNLDFLNPNVILTNPPDLEKVHKHVLCKFSNADDVEKAFFELKKITNYFTEHEKWVSFWDTIRSMKDFNDYAIFQNIGEVAQIILTLPHGNADVERVFSLMSDTKTKKKRNRILPATLSAVLRIKLDLHNAGNCCLDYKLNNNHIHKYKRNVYNKSEEHNDGESSSDSG